MLIDNYGLRTRAIILKKQNTGEYDQLVTCYTEEFGKLTAVVKSILKPSSIQAMHLDVFNLVDFELINGRAIPIIAGAQVDNSYINLKSNLQALAAAYFFAETIDRLAFDYQKDEKLWKFLVATINELNNGVMAKPACAGRVFFKHQQTEFLNVLGYEGMAGEDKNLTANYALDSIFER